MEANEAPTEPFYKRPLAVSRPVVLAVLAILALSACILLSLLFYFMTQPRPLKPPRFTATPNEFYVDGQPELLTFTELNNNAAAYQNKFIRITGSYFPQNCLTVRRTEARFSGQCWFRMICSWIFWAGRRR